MNEETSIKADHVSKKYCKSLKRSMFYGIRDIARNILGLSSRSEILKKNEFWAVDDVSFEIKKGETLGIIGPNGSGKTTLLKMLNGIFWPDRGKIMIKGRVGALIEVGAGFHPLLTGRENIYINAAILGMTKREVNKRLDEIVEFADITDFINVPVKHYSSGMFVRLGFAVAVHCNPDILLVDEVLAVGDLNFQNKCMKKMGEISDKGTTIIFVSHNIPAVQRICQKCLFLKKGKLIINSFTNKVVSEYYKWVSTTTDKPGKEMVQKCGKQNELSYFVICNADGKPQKTFETGEKILIKFGFLLEDRIYNPILHISLIGDTYHGYNTRDDNIEIDVLDSLTEILLEVDFLGLSSGVYQICIGLWDNNYIYPYYWNWDVEKIELSSSKPPMGRFIFKHSWKIQNKKTKIYK
ncbi:MAG: polysaccharide ABC transporter ATP-binding protein [bacterium]